MAVQDHQMISSKEDYRFFLAADKESMGMRDGIMAFLSPRWKYVRIMRRIEYIQNCKRGPFWGAYKKWLSFRLFRLSMKTKFLIRPNSFGPGISIAHEGCIGVNEKASIGENCRIHVGVTIGTAAGHTEMAPHIGNNVYIGPGAKVFGDIDIADGIAIGANAVVTKSFTEPNITLGGIPAKKISNKGSAEYLILGTEIVRERMNNGWRP